MNRPRITVALTGLGVLLAALSGSACGAADAPEKSSKKVGSALGVATALVDAFNRHDPAGMAALVAPDFELYYVDDKGVAALALTGPEQLVAEMTGYFAQQSEVRATIAASVDGPFFVAFREQIVGGQSSLAVYEVRAGLIRRVWYYPAEPAVVAAAP